MSWQIQEAKQRFSELVRAAEAGEPQIVTRHGAPIVVLIDIENYHRHHGERLSFMRFLRAEPHLGEAHDDALDIERSRDLPRDVDLTG